MYIVHVRLFNVLFKMLFLLLKATQSPEENFKN